MKSDSDNDPIRRRFLQHLLALPLLTPVASFAQPLPPKDSRKTAAAGAEPALKLSLNAYSFNKQLLEGTMTIDDVLEFCAELGLKAVDITAYYFKGYPEVPPDEMLYDVKRKAFSLGIEICGTGVRNDFTHSDAGKRKESVRLVKNWIEAAQKLGAQTMRIFSGTQVPEGYSRQEILQWMLDDIRECVGYASAHGVVVAIQNHDDFLKTSDEVIEVMEAIKSPWFGLMLDIGSFRQADPYAEIARTIKYAVTWQIKEKVFIEGKEVDVDAGKLTKLIRASGFRGYLPLETLGEGDTKTKVAVLYKKFAQTY